MHRIISFVTLLMVLCLWAGCHKEEEKKNIDPNLDLSAIPGMVTRDVSMLVSDSGKIKYHAIAPIWYRYDLDKSNPYQYFPEGIVLNQIDLQKNIIGHIQADTAYNFENKDLWHLISNVKIFNVQGERFTTNDLYWDARNHTVYSDSFIHIERNYDILEGYGFTSNDAFSEYEIRQTTGIFEVKEEDRQNADSLALDAGEPTGTDEEEAEPAPAKPAHAKSEPAPKAPAINPAAAPAKMDPKPTKRDIQPIPLEER